jgi:hypothetical protein
MYVSLRTKAVDLDSMEQLSYKNFNERNKNWVSNGANVIKFQDKEE